ncbi:hypothetical protein Q3G72_021584 [Acer saccharum]|nr:hypothetical protein Q3G72_021584 [Acer saccharum]
MMRWLSGNCYLEDCGTYLPYGKRWRAGKELAQIIVDAALLTDASIGFGQNLQVSTYDWENIFVILIAVYAVGMFTFFIGNMENLIKSAIDKKTEKRQKEDQAIKLTQQWPPFGKLFENLKITIIKEYQKYNGQQTRGVDNLNMFTNLPEDIKNNIKRELCLEMLKKVERFRRWSDASLLHLCDCAKPVVYVERTRIVHVGDPIDEMLFVLQGKLGTFSSEHTGSMNNVPPRDRRKDLVKDGDFWGEELVNWVQDESCSSSSSNKLISHTTIQALTKVEAFVLRIDDLKNLYNEKAKILRSWLRKRRIRISGRNTQTSTEEQTPPPPVDHQLTGPEFVV